MKSQLPWSLTRVAMTPAAAPMQPMEMDVMGPEEEGRTTAEQKGTPVFGMAPSTPPASQPAAWGGGFGSVAGGATAPAATRPNFQSPGMANMAKPQGAPDDPSVLYTSRPDGTVFGMAGAPGERWAGGK